MSIGIYALYWSSADLIYVGQTITLESRYAQHISLLKNNKHFNRKVQNTYNIEGIPEYHILKYTDTSNLDEEEISLIKEFDSFKGTKGLNLSPGGSSSHGEDHPNSMYTNDQIEKAFLCIVNRNIPHRNISLEYNISIDVIKAISRGKLHGWLSEKYPEQYKKMLLTIKEPHNSGQSHPMATISNAKVLEIFEALIDRSKPLTEIAKDMDVSYGLLSLIACGSAHSWLKETYPFKYQKMLQNLGKVVKNYPLITNGTDIIDLSNTCVGTFCSKNNLQHPNLSKVLNGIRKSHKGWYLYKESL